MTENTGHSGYWYSPDAPSTASAVDLLNELRRYRESNARMRAKAREQMAMGDKDLLALRHLLAAQAEGRQLRQQDLVELLEIRPASVSVLVDRLVRDGHAERTPHPDDRRSTAVVPTEHAHHEVRSTMEGMHERMIAVAESLSDQERAVVVRFLQGLNHSGDLPESHH